MSLIVPVPLLSLYTAKMLESAVCGNEDVDLQMLKKVVRYMVVMPNLWHSIPIVQLVRVVRHTHILATS